MAGVTLSGVGKVFANGARAVADLDLAVGDGELMALVGPSGCGKSTTLRMTAGLEEVSEGEIRIGERVVTSLGPRERDVAMVFQSYALYPHMTVFDNLAFPLRARGSPRGEVRARVARTASLLGLDGLLARKPRALSGGERQRVAMGRAVIREPQVFLMDEPLSNLDAQLRSQMRAEISSLQRALGVTTIYVTHDQVEAMTMGTRIAVLRNGRLQQQGSPQAVYDDPDNLFVAGFIGTPAMNLLRCRIERDGDGLHCRVGDQRLPIATTHRSVAALAGRAGSEVALGLRPESLGDPAAAPERARLHGRVRHVEVLGAEKNVQLELDASPVAIDRVGEGAERIDGGSDRVRVSGAPRARVTARIGAHADVGLGASAELAVDNEHLFFFDLATGRAIR